MPQDYMSSKLPPHVRSKETAGDIMLDVSIALLPSAVMGVHFFGLRSAFVLIAALLSSIVADVAVRFVKTRRIDILKTDKSPLVTGILVGLCLPAHAPLWVPFVGGFFAIAVIKQLKIKKAGGNIFNPALGGLLLVYLMVPNLACDIGVICETAAWPLVLGFAYLCVRKIARVHITVAYIFVFLILSWIFRDINPFGLLSQGLVLITALFMATDFRTSPAHPLGQIIFGLGCGVVVVVLQSIAASAGSHLPVIVGVLLMNITAPIMDRAIRNM